MSIIFVNWCKVVDKLPSTCYNIKYQRYLYITKEGGCEVDIRRYDIVQADLGQVIGSEQGGIRPVLIIQNDVGNIYSCTTIIMPLSSKLKSLNQPTHTLIKRSIDTGLKTDSVLLGEQMRVISSQRIIKKIGTVTDETEREEIRRVYQANFGE